MVGVSWASYGRYGDRCDAPIACRSTGLRRGGKMTVQASDNDGSGGDELQRLLRESAHAFATKDSSLGRVRKLKQDGTEFDREIWAKCAELGWTGMLVPEQYGGSELDISAFAVVAEELGEQLVPEPLVSAAGFAARLITLSSNEELKKDLLPKLVSGDLIPAVAWQENARILDPEPTRTRARAAGETIILSGEKDHIRPGADCDGFVVSAAADGGCALYWVPAETSGMEVSRQLLADGTSLCRLVLDTVSIPASMTLAAPGDGVDQLRQAFDETLLLVCAELNGLTKAALEITIEYLRTRVQFDKPIGSFQVLQHRAVDLFIQQEIAVAVAEEALAAAADQSNERTRSAEASRAKARCSDAALLITREAIQLHGAIGFTDEHDIGMYLNRALVLSAWLGNGAMHRKRFAALRESANIS